ncbi:GtrA family protein [Gammaproteobacteria bacterium]|nr:GtrA family protein [Gammaproteobacteria bacterium]
MMMDRTTLIQAFRYGVFGIATNAVGYLLYVFVTELGLDPKLAVSLLTPIAVAISYFGNKQWTFEHSGRYLSSSEKYIIIHIFSYLINISMLLYFVDTLGFPHQLIQGIAIFVCAGFLFVGLKFIVFHKN